MTEEERHDEHRQAEAHDSGRPDHDAEATAAGKGAEQGKGNAAAGEGADAQAGTSPSLVIPDIAHYLIGWRAWALSAPDGNKIGPPFLASFNGPHPWPHKNPLIATCDRGEASHNENTPCAECTCGIYAYKTKELFDREFSRSVRDNLVRGTVALWGKVIECEDGWRAQYAYPIKILVPPFSEPAEHRNRLMTAWALGEAYGVEVEMLPTIEPPKPPQLDPSVRVVSHQSWASSGAPSTHGNGGIGRGVGAPKAVWDAYERR